MTVDRPAPLRPDGEAPRQAPPLPRGFIIALLLAGLVLAAILGLLLQGVTRDSFVMPLLYAAWLADLVFRSVPGWLWWAWFLVIALVLAARSLRTRAAADPIERGDRRRTEGVIHAWMARIQSGDQGDYFRWRLARDLAELALQFLAFRDRSDLGQRDRSQYVELLNAPPEIRAYLHTGLTAPPWQPQDMRSRLARLWRPITHTKDSPLEIEPALVAQFLEGQLEKEHDD
jgi:hypothetical protein